MSMICNKRNVKNPKLMRVVPSGLASTPVVILRLGSFLSSFLTFPDFPHISSSHSLRLLSDLFVFEILAALAVLKSFSLSLGVTGR
jgi:hypothetical protein